MYLRPSHLKILQIMWNINKLANVPSHLHISWLNFDEANLKWTSSNRVFKNFANTIRAPPTHCFWKFLYCFMQKNAYFWICLQSLSQRISQSFKMLGKLWIILTVCNFNKNVALPQEFPWHFYDQVLPRASPNGSFWKWNKICCFTPVWTIWWYIAT